MKFIYDEGATPINQDEVNNLIPSSIFTQKDLNIFEQRNISEAERKLFKRGCNFRITCEFVKKVHKKMFDITWKWAGKYRTFNTNIGVDWPKINQEMIFLCDDVNYQIENNVYDIEEIAVRFSHRLVLIHPFPNGNGRCSRLIADLLVFTNGLPRFTWGNKNLTDISDVRERYIKALREADNHNINPLLKFARR